MRKFAAYIIFLPVILFHAANGFAQWDKFDIVWCKVSNTAGPKGSIILVPGTGTKDNELVYRVMMKSSLNIYEVTKDSFEARSSKDDIYTLIGDVSDFTSFKLTLNNGDPNLTIIFDDGSDDAERLDVKANCQAIGKW